MSLNIMPKVTMEDIAKAANVSSATVSRALNGASSVTQQTQTRILEIAKQLGYVPDFSARQLAKGTSHFIGVTPFADSSLRNPYFALLLEAIQSTLFERGYTAQVLRHNTPIDERRFAGVIVPGVYLHDPRPQQLKASGIPFVVIGLGEPRDDIASIEVDNRVGMLYATRHLLSLGHRRLAHLTGTPIGKDATVRLEAYKEALQQAGVPFDPDLVLDGEFTELGAYRAVTRAWRKKQRFTGLVCASDEMALGAMLALEDLGVNVPSDVSITGFDDLPLERYQKAGLTTVHQPFERIGQETALLLFEQMQKLEPRWLMLQPKLVVRQTTGRVKE